MNLDTRLRPGLPLWSRRANGNGEESSKPAAPELLSIQSGAPTQSKLADEFLRLIDRAA
jgi:hypothetical protein